MSALIDDKKLLIKLKKFLVNIMIDKNKTKAAMVVLKLFDNMIDGIDFVLD